MSQFTRNFKPDRRDILYGLTETRAAYLTKFIKSKHNDNDFTIGDKGFYINDYNEPIVFGNAFARPEDVDKIFDAIDWGKQEDYLSALVDTKHAPGSVFSRASWRDLAKGNAAVLQSLKQTSPKDMAFARMVLAVRRSCKYGIEYVSSLKTGAHVHYALDGISMSDVVAKTQTNLWVGTVGVPITTSELRYLFRNWNHFSGRANILFYRNCQVVQPPWESDPQTWFPYADHLIKKNLGRQGVNQGTLGLCILDGIQKRYSDCIRRFHTLPLATPT